MDSHQTMQEEQLQTANSSQKRTTAGAEQYFLVFLGRGSRWRRAAWHSGDFGGQTPSLMANQLQQPQGLHPGAQTSIQVSFSWSSLSIWSLPSLNPVPISTPIHGRGPWGGMMPSSHSEKQDPESQSPLSTLGCSQQTGHISWAWAQTPWPSSLALLEALHRLEALRGFAPSGKPR